VFASGQSPVDAYLTIFNSTFGSTQNALKTLSLSAPLILVSLGLLLAFKAQFWNGGGEGQMLLGGLTGIVVTYTLNLNNTPVMIALGFMCAFAAGGAWAGLSGILKVKFNVDDIVSTLLLSLVAQLLVFYLVRVPFRNPQLAQASVIGSVVLPDAALLPSIGGLNAAFLFALAWAIILYFLLKRTKLGFKVKVLGSNKETAIAYFGRSQTNLLFVLVAILSGGFIGMGGMVMANFTHNMVAGSSGGAYSAGGFTNSYGFIGIAMAFLAQLDPLGAIPTSIFFVALVTGGLGLVVLMNIPGSLTLTISAISILFISARAPIIKRLDALRGK
jgi:simple sugar transport system permease protein